MEKVPSLATMNARSSKSDKLHHDPSRDMKFGSIRATYGQAWSGSAPAHRELVPHTPH